VLKGRQGRGRRCALRAGSRRRRASGTRPWTAGGGDGGSGAVVSRATAECEVENLLSARRERASAKISRTQIGDAPP
jgi:hypothetical protein